MSVQIEGVPFNRILSFPLRDGVSFRRLLAVMGFTLLGLFIPIVSGLFVAGYAIKVLRQEIREGGVSMPAWSEESRMLLDGAYALIIEVLYLLPGFFVLIGTVALYFVSFLLIIPSGRSSNFSMISFFIPMQVMFFGMLLSLALPLLGALPLPVALARFADEGRFGTAFQIDEIFHALKKNPTGFLCAWIVASEYLLSCISFS